MMQFPRQGPEITWRSVVALVTVGGLCLYLWSLLWYMIAG